MKFTIHVAQIGTPKAGGGVLIFDDHNGSYKENYMVTFVPFSGAISTGGIPRRINCSNIELGLIPMKDIKRLAKAS